MTAEQGSTLSSSAPGAKPIRLRSACDQCFAAKVRCEGTRTGCARCIDKRLPCHFSPSMVGKVVGKRKKRPIDDTFGTINSSSWIVNSYTPPETPPSPAITNAAEELIKKSCTNSGWQSFLSLEETSPSYFGSPDTQHYATDMSDMTCFDNLNELSMFSNSNSGLVTPALSPPQVQYLSPMMLEAQPPSRSVSVQSDLGPPFYKPSTTSSNPRPSRHHPSDVKSSEDEETVCIRLLGHLKKQSQIERTSLHNTRTLIRNSTAAVRRILKSRTVRREPVCLLLLSSIMLHITTLCEDMSRLECEQQQQQQQQQQITLSQSQHLPPPTINGTSLLHHSLSDSALHDGAEILPFHPVAPSSNPSNNQTADGTSSVSATTIQAVQEALATCRSVADLLRSKPSSGFQCVGRQEGLHVMLLNRLVGCLRGVGGGEGEGSS